MKSRLFLFMVLFCFLLTVIPANVIMATSVTYPIGFEGTTPNTPYTSSLMNSQKKTAYYNCSSAKYRSGVAGAQRSFYSGAGGSGWFNLTYSKSNYMTGLSLWFDMVGGGASTTATQIYLYNKTSSGSNYNIYIAKLIVNTQNNYLHYLDSTNTSQLFYSGGSALLTDNFNMYMINFTITDNLGDATYYFTKVGTSAVTVHSTLKDAVGVHAGKRIDRIFIQNYASGSFYMDDMNITISDSYTATPPVSYGCGLDYSMYNSKSTLYSSSDYVVEYVPMTGNKYLEIQYAQYLTTGLHGVSLLIGVNQYLYDNLTSDYGLYVNGITCGDADCIEPYMNEYTYRLTWDFTTVSLTNARPLFAFYSKNGWKGLPYVHYATYGSPNWGQLSYHNSATFYTNNIQDGTYFSVGGTYQVLPMMFYYGTLTVTNATSGYTDLLTTTYTNYNQYQTIPMIYTINSTASAGAVNYIKVYKNGAGQITYVNQEIPYTIPISIFSGQWSFTPMIGGTYKLCLYRGSANVSVKTITVTNVSNANYLLWANPNPHEKGSGYIVGYRYYNPYGKNGTIAEYQGANVIDMDFSEAGKVYLSSNVSGNITVNSGIGINIWVLYARIDALTYSELYRITVDDIAPSNSENSISVDQYATGDIHVIYHGNTYAPIYIRGTTKYVALDTYVSLNGERVYPVSHIGLDSPYGFYHNISKTGNYNVTLRLYTSNGTKYLASYLFSVMTEDQYSAGGGGSANNFNFVRDLIPEEYRFYVGIGVIIAFTLMPLALLLAYASKAKTQINIPALPLTVVSMIMSFIGFVLTIMWGLMPWWSFVGLIFFLVLILVILYIVGKGKSGND